MHGTVGSLEGFRTAEPIRFGSNSPESGLLLLQNRLFLTKRK
ncbi:hypothetical protein G159_04175 [Planococcus glaciei CHR43]|nr:hypothetical protein G159_04175 [Planococcus glaciei CHR43]